MADISIVELFFFGFVELLSLSMLIISVIKEIPDTKSRSIIRAIYLIPGMIAAGFLATTGMNVTFNTILTNSTVQSNVTNEVFTEAANQANFIVLQNPMWGIFHMLIFFVLFIFVINQMVNLLTKPE